ncbi:beta strand repeat-containing protein [Taibaiella soli]|uniref:Uncharacterized protein n=1 Tax=Taibaiella soli TaxID=1649169 RepID=A0A2W2A8A5_9BACT|nr:autotransporter-associated beta strand repeat-containing protein [Taibaiella soli]PZF71491.1 hypothetical protein DN068_18160 [Taibaiella soli]
MAARWSVGSKLYLIVLLIFWEFPDAYAQTPVQQFWLQNQSVDSLIWDNTAGNGVIDNGSGTWDTTSLNWLHSQIGFGTVNDNWPGASKRKCRPAIFGGNPGVGNAGTVTLAYPIANVMSINFKPVPGGNFTITGQSIQSCAPRLNLFTAPNVSATIASSITGAPALIKSGTGTLILTGANTYTGTTTVATGTLQVGNNGTTGTLGTGSVTNNDSLMYYRSDAIAVPASISGAGNLILQTAGNINPSNGSAITQSSITANGTQFSLTNTNWKAPVINANGNYLPLNGTITIDATGGAANFTFNNTGNYAIASGNGTTLNTFGNVTLTGNMTAGNGIYGGIGFGNTLKNTGGLLKLVATSIGRVAYEAGVTGSYATGINIVGNVEIDGMAGVFIGNYHDIASAGQVLGNGTLTLVGNRYGFNLQSNVLDNGGPFAVIFRTTDAANGTIVVSGTIGVGALTFDVAGGTSTLNGLIRNGTFNVCTITKAGAGTVQLGGANTYTGGTTINAGTLTAGSINAFGTGTITVNAGGTLNKNGFAITNTVVNNGGTVIP